MTAKKKLIEVALPLDAINEASVREKSIRHGHPSTLHLWWARRPLAAARAVIWASLVDDPSAHPEEFPTEEDQAKERARLFKILEELVVWENSNNQRVLDAAKAEVRSSMGDEELKFLDPFAGGGAIPLEAQRLGLKAYAQDLNPVPVVINKAMIEIPPRFADLPPVNPDDRQRLGMDSWAGHSGLAADVEHYGQWMRDRAFERIGHLYPTVEVPAEQGGGERTVIAWLWARTVKCPNPACGCETPLVKSWDLSRKKGKEWHVEPHVHGDHVDFTVVKGKSQRQGTVGRGRGAACVKCGEPMGFDYIKDESKADRMGAQLMAIVTDGVGGRTFVSPTAFQTEMADVARPVRCPSAEIAHYPGCLNTSAYGLDRFEDLFTNRQLVTMTTFAELVEEAKTQVTADALQAGYWDDETPLCAGGRGARAYGEAVGVYLALVVDKMADYNSSICTWDLSRTGIRNTFGRQAIPMSWDYAEANPFSGLGGSFESLLAYSIKVIEGLPTDCLPGVAIQHNAQEDSGLRGMVVSTDPPYYDNVPYADLSDFFYLWMRPSLRATFPRLFQTVRTPKAEELVAPKFRFGGDQEAAKAFFESGMLEAFRRIHAQARDDAPVTVYYAYKQSETTSTGTASSGWETMLSAVIRAGFVLTGTWPVRTELANRTMASGMNALASSIVLVLRKRSANASIATRREFAAELSRDLRPAVQKLQASNLAPVDMAQSAIGPGMAIFSQYSQVLELDGTPMTVRTALELINHELSSILDDQDGDLDRESQFCVDMYRHHGFFETGFGEMQVLATAKNVSLEALKANGAVESGGGKVRLKTPGELPSDVGGNSSSVWLLTNQLVGVLQTGGVKQAAEVLVPLVGSKADDAKALAYTLHSIAERRGSAEEALGYNSLVASWDDIQALAADIRAHQPVQRSLDI